MTGKGGTHHCIGGIDDYNNHEMNGNHPQKILPFPTFKGAERKFN